MKSFRVSLAQVNTTVGDFERNIDLILTNARAASELGAELVVFTELAICGYPP